MTTTAIILAMLLGQQAEPGPAPTPSGDEPAATVVKQPAADAPVVRRGPPDELNRMLNKLKDAPPDQRPALIDEIHKKYGIGSPVPMVPGADIDIGKYRELPETDQARVIARDFLNDLLSGNSAAAALRCGVPFMMEEHRFEHAEDLRSEWARHLRSKRTDLLSVYDLEVLTPAEMEKKYGRPPQRLSSWNWRSQGVLLVVANVSGRATVMMMRPYGAMWQVVGFHD